MTLEEIVEVLNRAIAIIGEVQAVPSQIVLLRDLAAHVQRVEAKVDEQGASLTALEVEHVYEPPTQHEARREAAQRLKNEIADTKKFLRADGNRTSVYADYLEDALAEVVRLMPEFGEEVERHE